MKYSRNDLVWPSSDAAPQSSPSSCACPCGVQRLVAGGEVGFELQPIVDLATGRAFAHEALVRCGHPECGSPRQLFDAALLQGCAGALGRAVRNAAIRTHPDQTLFLNVHPHELREGWLLEPEEPIYRHAPGVYLEITESVPLTQLAESREVLRRIRERGVHIVIDDLGAGYSNLRYIADFNPSLVKLDRTLVRGLDRSSRMFRLVAAIVVMADSLDAEVVAEGIETEEELLAVRDAGVQFGQGYLLARPAFPAPEVYWPLSADESSDGPGVASGIRAVSPVAGLDPKKQAAEG